MGIGDPPPPPLECIKGPYACTFSGKVVFWSVYFGKISRESPGKGSFLVKANGYQYPIEGVLSFARDRGVQMTGNEHRYS